MRRLTHTLSLIRVFIERSLADSIFVLLMLIIILLSGWLTARHEHYWDWTRQQRNTLTPESSKVLQRLDAPLHITVFAERSNPLVKPIEQVLTPYRRELPALSVDYLDPQRFPEQARQADVSLVGQVVVDYQGRRDVLSELNERTLTAAIQRVSQERAVWLMTLEGHGERRLDSPQGTDLGRLAQLLSERGIRWQSIDLSKVQSVPINTSVLLLTTPAIDLFPDEIQPLADYLDNGGSLLWLMDPESIGGLDPIADKLGIERLPGTIVDANVRDLGIDTPTVAMVADYSNHTLTGSFSSATLYPGATALARRAAPGWTLETTLETRQHSWNETGRLEGNIDRDEVIGEQAGPLAVALALSRPHPQGGDIAQRVLVVGDGDFLSNAHLGNAGNQDMGLRMVRWVAGQDALVSIPERPGGDRELRLDNNRRLAISIGALGVIPGLLLITGLLIRLRRRLE